MRRRASLRAVGLLVSFGHTLELALSPYDCRTLINSASSFPGSKPMASAISMNSTRSSRRSPDSYFDMKDWGRRSRQATSSCDSPAAARLETNSSWSRA